MTETRTLWFYVVLIWFRNIVLYTPLFSVLQTMMVQCGTDIRKYHIMISEVWHVKIYFVSFSELRFFLVIYRLSIYVFIYSLNWACIPLYMMFDRCIGLLQKKVMLFPWSVSRFVFVCLSVCLLKKLLMNFHKVFGLCRTLDAKQLLRHCDLDPNQDSGLFHMYMPIFILRWRHSSHSLMLSSTLWLALCRLLTSMVWSALVDLFRKTYFSCNENIPISLLMLICRVIFG